MSDNNTVLVGNLTRDPELRFTPSGVAVAGFGLAVNRVRYDKSTNEKIEEVSFFDVDCWQDLATNVANSLGKGNRVIVTGRLEQQTWENKEGVKCYKVHVVANSIGPDLRWATAEVTRNESKSNRGAQSTEAPPLGNAPYEEEEGF